MWVADNLLMERRWPWSCCCAMNAGVVTNFIFLVGTKNLINTFRPRVAAKHTAKIDSMSWQTLLKIIHSYHHLPTEKSSGFLNFLTSHVGSCSFCTSKKTLFGPKWGRETANSHQLDPPKGRHSISHMVQYQQPS